MENPSPGPHSRGGAPLWLSRPVIFDLIPPQTLLRVIMAKLSWPAVGGKALLKPVMPPWHTAIPGTFPGS